MDLSTRTARRRSFGAATLIASAALALGIAGPATAAPSAAHVRAPAIAATPSALPEIPSAGGAPASRMRPLSLAAEVPIIEDPAELAAGQAATLPATGVDMPLFLVAAALGGLLGIGLCVAAALRS
jgi:hypothetical protein